MDGIDVHLDRLSLDRATSIPVESVCNEELIRV